MISETLRFGGIEFYVFHSAGKLMVNSKIVCKCTEDKAMFHAGHHILSCFYKAETDVEQYFGLYIEDKDKAKDEVKGGYVREERKKSQYSGFQALKKNVKAWQLTVEVLEEKVRVMGEAIAELREKLECKNSEPK